MVSIYVVLLFDHRALLAMQVGSSLKKELSLAFSHGKHLNLIIFTFQHVKQIPSKQYVMQFLLA